MGDKSMITPSTSGPSPDEDSDRVSPNQSQIRDQANADSKDESSDDAETGDDIKATAPVQKRRRVTRACDECRRKKIKCDGKQPCTHCTVYSYECTYDQPSNRRRNPAPQYIEALEQRLQKAEKVLRIVLPGVDLDDPKFDAHGVDQIVQSAKSKKAPVIPETGEDGQIQPMIDRVGSLDLDDQDNWEFHGHSSGFAFMRKFRAHFGEQYLPYPSTLRPRNVSHLLESPRSAHSSPFDNNVPTPIDLPSKEAAIQLCRNALDDCCALMRPIHQPTFYQRLYSIYDTDPEHFSTDQLKFLPCLYVVMGLGCLFSRNEGANSMLEMKGYKEAIEQGYLYFSAGKQMLDITDCRDLLTIQAVYFMICFLQSSAKLATCYGYIGIALRACCRLGLHRDLPHKFSPIEAEERKRIFWLIRKMDTYVGAMLGLPQMLSEDDIDQEFPAEVDDVYITDDGIGSMPEGLFPLIKATNSHTRLTIILRKVVKYIYPVQGSPNLVAGDSYTVSHGRIRELEQDLQTWMHELPMQLRPAEDVGTDLSRVQQLLRISYAHVQMMMYRPFIHYVSQASQKGNADRRSFACAAACVSVARNIVHITSEMKRRGLLVGAYWFVMYTTYFAIISLVYFCLENPNSPTGDDILKDALEGRETLQSLAKRSLAADRCCWSLTSLFNELPEKLKERRSSMASPTSGKKRAAPSDSHKTQVNQNSSSVSTTGRDIPGTSSRQRTIPQDYLAKLAKRNSMPDAPTFGFSHPPNPQLMNINSPVVASPLSQQFEFPAQVGQSQIPDLKNVMFPSDNPFAYGNQPLATLESVDPGYGGFNGDIESFSGSNEQSMMGTPSSMPSSLHTQQHQQSFDMNSFQRLYEDNSPLAQQMAAGRHFNATGGGASAGYTSAGGEQHPSQLWNTMHSLPPQEVQGQQGQAGQEDYWTQVGKGNMVSRTGFTPGANLDDLFGGDGWGGQGVWGGGGVQGMGMGMGPG